MAEILSALGKGLHRTSSSFSLRSIASARSISSEDSVKGKETWKKLYKDLNKSGVTADMLDERKEEILALFQGSSPPVVPRTNTENSTTIDGSDEPSKDAKIGKKKQNKTSKLNWAPVNTLVGPLLVDAAKEGDLNACRRWLTVIGGTDYQDTALCWAAQNGHIETVKLLLDRGARTEATEATVLRWAAESGNTKTVKWLLDSGAYIKTTIGIVSRRQYNRRASSGLHIMEPEKELLEESLEERSHDTEAMPVALSVAVQNRHMQVAKLLLKRGANMEGAYSHVKLRLVTGEKVVRATEIIAERGSITRGGDLRDFDHGKLIEFELLDSDTRDASGNRHSAQRALDEFKSLLYYNPSSRSERNTSRLSDALVKTMVFTLNTLLPPAVMCLMPPSRIGLVNCGPGQGPTVQPWPEGIQGRMWHWPLVVQMEVDPGDGTGPKMEEQVVRITLILRERGRWFVMRESVEALLTLWLFTLKQKRAQWQHLSIHKANRVRVQPPFVRLIGSNTELTRWDMMTWCAGHYSRVYEGKPMTITEVSTGEFEAGEIDIEMGGTLVQVMGIEQVDLRSEDEWGEGQQISSPQRVFWHYFRGRELPHGLDDHEYQPRDRDRRYTSLALAIHEECTLEELYAQEILFRFFFAIGTFMREEKGIRVPGNTTISSRNINVEATRGANEAIPERRLMAVKFHNTILERIALEAYQSKVCGSLEAAYDCVIPAFSQARVLPEAGEVMSSEVMQTFRALEKR